MNELSIKKQYSGIVFETGYKVAEEKGLALVWMSVGNSYFKKDSIKKIVDFVSSNFEKVKFLIPFHPAIYTYQALGYDEKKAITKARLGSNRLTNHILRAIDGSGSKNMDVVNWDKEIVDNKNYKKQLEFIRNLYKKNSDFFQNANETTKSVLKAKTKNNLILEKNIGIGVNYLLEELAFVLASPDIFSVSKTAYIYHKKWPIFEKLVNGEYDSIVRRKN